jgi:5-methylcytosine-specific restriction protein A
MLLWRCHSYLVLSKSPRLARDSPSRRPTHHRPHLRPRARRRLPHRIQHPGRGRKLKAPTPCATPGCHGYATTNGRGKCQEHQPPPWQGSTRKERLPSDWSTRRLIVLKRDKGICHLCGNAGADTIDHLIQGDDHSLTNLAPVHDRLAPHCHRTKSSNEGHQAKLGNRTKRKL